VLVHIIVILTMPVAMVLWYLIQGGSGRETRPGWGRLDSHKHGGGTVYIAARAGGVLPTVAPPPPTCSGNCASCVQATTSCDT